MALDPKKRLRTFAEALSFVSDNRFKDGFLADLDGLCADLLIPVEAEAQQISLVNMIVVKVLRKLLLAAGIVFLSAPDFHLDDILFSVPVDN